MKKNENTPKVQVVATELGLRATSLRASLTNVVAIRKVGDSKEFRAAMAAFDKAVDEFRRVII